MSKNKDEIIRETFDHLVDLAEFALEEGEARYLLRELNSQLSAIHQLEAIPLDEDLPPASHGVPYPQDRKQPLREDLWDACKDASSILGQAPQTEGGYIVVPDIPHTDLD